MNPNLIVSLSLLVMGLALAVFFYATGSELGQGTNFSVKFMATIDSDGSSHDSEIYFCTGNDCNYYQDIYDEYGYDYEYPEFFALVGFDTGGGEVVIAELTLGYTFTFQDGILAECKEIPHEDGFDVVEEAKAIASNAQIGSFQEGTVISMGNSTITIRNHDIGFDPDIKASTVLGMKIPSPKECEALGYIAPDEDQGTVVDASDPSTWVELDVELLPARRTLEEERQRRLDNVATASTFQHMLKAASGSYHDLDLDDLEKPNEIFGNFKPIHTCTVDNAYATFFTDDKNVNLAIRGSDDFGDFVDDVSIGEHDKYHQGFLNHYMKLKQCINHYRKELKEEDKIELDYITGHSLGGAVATLYVQDQENEAPLVGVVTFGAPRTNKKNASIKGWRFAHMKDPVPLSVGGWLGGWYHVVENAFELKDEETCRTVILSETRERQKFESCSRSWWKFWCWFDYIWVKVTKSIEECTTQYFVNKSDKNFGDRFPNPFDVSYHGTASYANYDYALNL